MALTSFVGRKVEEGRLSDAVCENRLVTVTGAGGCGKTRLVLQIAAAISGSYRDGIRWVELGPLSDGALVGLAVAAALGLQTELGRSIIDTITDQLAGQELLLVLDNAEHVLADTASLVEHVVERTTGVRVVVTSRAPLGVAGEVTWRVPGLAPTAGVQLFIERARLVRPAFDPDASEASIVRGICEVLDGLPLAIELAASRIRMMSPRMIAAGLDDRFRLLRGSVRTRLPHQRTLEASVTWSFDLLETDERALFRRLSIFAGGFSALAAEQVCAFGDVDADSVLDVLVQLVDKSLVQVDDGADTRYRLLETVREFARARLLEAGETDTAEGTHRSYFLAYAEQLAPRLPFSDGPVFLARLDEDIHNFQAALRSADESRDEHALWRLVVALGLFFELRHAAIGAKWLGRALDMGGDGPALWAKVLWQSAHLGVYGDDLATTAKRAPEAVAAANIAGDTAMVGRSLNTANYCNAVSNPRTARVALEHSIGLCRAADDDWGTADGLKMATIACLTEGDTDGLHETEKDLRVLAESMGNPFYLAWCHGVTGYVALRRGEIAVARHELARSLALCRMVGEPMTGWLATAWIADLDALTGDTIAANVGYTETLRRASASGGTVSQVWGLIGLARLAREDTKPSDALAILEPAIGGFRDADPLWRSLFFTEHGAALLDAGDEAAAESALSTGLESANSITNSDLIATASFHLARLARHRSQFHESQDLHHRALSMRLKAGLIPGVLESLEALAGIASEQDCPIEAVRLFAATSHARTRLGLPQAPFIAATCAARLLYARSSLDWAAHSTAEAEGSALSVAVAAAYASRGRGERKRPTHGWGSLTPTECQVVEFVAAGLTNPQIAERMFIGRGTVKSHLSHVFAKLGATTRAAVAAEAIRRGQ